MSCVIEMAEFPIVSSFMHFDQPWISVMVSVFCNKKFHRCGVRAAFTSVFKNEYLECS